MELNNEQREKRIKSLAKLKGRCGIIRNPFYTTAPKDTKVYIYTVIPEEGILGVEYQLDNGEFTKCGCFPEELNLTDKEYSGTGMVLKGVREERKDKYGNICAVELLNDGKSIYISQALSSLLLCNSEQNYIGFASDPEIGESYVFNAKTADQGYLLDKKNNRIISPADHRELLKEFESNVIEINDSAIINSEFPDTIFYKTRRGFQTLQNTPVKTSKKSSGKPTTYESLHESLNESLRTTLADKMLDDLRKVQYKSKNLYEGIKHVSEYKPFDTTVNIIKTNGGFIMDSSTEEAAIPSSYNSYTDSITVTKKEQF